MTQCVDRMVGAAFPLLAIVKVLKEALLRFGMVELASEKPWTRTRTPQGAPMWRALQGAVDPVEPNGGLFPNPPPRGKEISFRVHLDGVYMLGAKAAVEEILSVSSKTVTDQVRQSVFAWRIEHDLRLAVLSTTQSTRWSQDLELTYVDAGYFDNDGIALVSCRVSKTG